MDQHDHNHNHNHTVFLVYSPVEKMERWYVDLSGPQFSISYACWGRDVYRAIHQTSKRSLTKKGATKAGYEHLIETKEKDSDEAILGYKMACHVVRNMQKARREWEGANNMKLAEVLARPDTAEYERLTGEFLGFVNERMTELRDSFDWREEILCQRELA